MMGNSNVVMNGSLGYTFSHVISNNDDDHANDFKLILIMIGEDAYLNTLSVAQSSASSFSAVLGLLSSGFVVDVGVVARVYIR